MKKETLIRLMLSMLVLLTIDAYSQKAYFLHHSTGGAVYSQGHVVDTIEAYNAVHGTNYQLDQRGFPSSPYPHDNYPYDYWNLWINGACNSENPKIECLESMLERYDVVIFKHCFPGSNIVEDIATPSVSSQVKCLGNYKLQYRALRAKMDAFPNKKFIVWTLAPLHRSSTNEEKAQRAREFVNWVKNDWLTEDDQNHPNIFIFDFFNIVAENNENPQQGKVNCLKYEYEKNHNNSDSHPNEQANIVAGSAFANFIISVFQAQATTAPNNKTQTILSFNASTNSLYVQPVNNEKGTISIYDTLGKKHASFQCSSNKTINLSHLKKNMYIVNYTNNNNQSITKKIIIK